MKAFTMGDFRFEVLSYAEEMRGQFVVRRFIVDAFYQNQPLNWHPNQIGRDDFPDIPNRLIYEFAGRPSVDVFDDRGRKTGTKAGANFRPSFFVNLVLLARKAVRANSVGKTIAQVTDAEWDKSAVTAPVDLTKQTLEESVKTLTGAA